MRRILFGTDWWTDCDDAVALRLLARAHKAGQIRIEGIGINACMDVSAPSLEGFLRLEGVCDVPIGLDQKAIDFGGNPPYQKRLAAHAKKYPRNADALDAVTLYRTVLAKSPKPVEIIEVGFLQVIADVLESGPDAVSEKNGLELVREKVSHIWVMAGKWDENPGKENNFCRNARAVSGAARFLAQCPVPVTFLGWEVGRGVLTGGQLRQEDFLYQVLCDHGSHHGRHSWDPMLTLLALAGDAKTAGYRTVRGFARVDARTGENYFAPDAAGPHAYVVKEKPDDWYQKQINALIG